MVVLPVINRWFVSVEKPKSSRALPGFVREAKTFPTGAEAICEGDDLRRGEQDHRWHIVGA